MWVLYTMYSSTTVYAVSTEHYQHVTLVAQVYTVDGYLFCLNLSYMHLINYYVGSTLMLPWVCPVMSTPISYHSEVFCDMLIHLFLCPITECCWHPCCSSGISVRSMSNGMLTGWDVHTLYYLPSLPLLNVLLCLFFVYCIYLFIFCLFFSFVDCLFNWSTEMAVLTWMASSMLSNPMMSSPRYRICWMLQDGLEGIMLTWVLTDPDC